MKTISRDLATRLTKFMDKYEYFLSRGATEDMAQEFAWQLSKAAIGIKSVSWQGVYIPVDRLDELFVDGVIPHGV